MQILTVMKANIVKETRTALALKVPVNFTTRNKYN
jgi:hypothetical protein